MNKVCKWALIVLAVFLHVDVLTWAVIAVLITPAIVKLAKEAIEHD